MSSSIRVLPRPGRVWVTTNQGSKIHVSLERLLKPICGNKGSATRYSGGNETLPLDAVCRRCLKATKVVPDLTELTDAEAAPHVEKAEEME